MDTELNIPNKYRKKPIVVEAMQISRFNLNEILTWGNKKIEQKYADFTGFSSYHFAVTIITSTGTHTASEGDWIVKGINGEFYAMPNDTFKELYEPVNDTADENIPVIDWMEKV